MFFAEYQGLTVKEMEELRDDIKMHLDLDRESQTNVKYWEVHALFFYPFFLNNCAGTKMHRYITFFLNNCERDV